VTDFGDFNPEDAWDIGDPPEAKARNLARRIEFADGLPRPVSPVVLILLLLVYVRMNEKRLADGDTPYLQRLREDILSTLAELEA
jgi:hypothetical protein